MLGREALQALIPHQGTMCLLDGVDDWNAQRIVCRTRSHQRADNPLRTRGSLRAVHLCEYGAQAMAVHGGLLAQAAGEVAQPGLLVSLRGVLLQRRYIDDLAGELKVEAEQLLAATGSWQYRFSIRHGDDELASGRAAVMLLPRQS
jgi:predicted hotdog family 3-hydroxylacyl-ACP dehydratase